jgi:tetratricopeptide (TPR) repeat protein
MATRPDATALAALPDEASSRQRFEQVLASLFRADARALSTIEPALERERRHAAAAGCWLAGDVARAARLYGELLRDDPRDRLALRAAHGLDFRLGQREMLRDRVKAVLPHWSASDREYGYLLAMYAFGLEETSDYDRVLAMARKSLEFVPDNAAAIHVIAHVLEMRGPPEKGIAWLRTTQPIWIGNAGYRVHLAWHLALFQLDADARRPTRSPPTTR